MRLLSPRILSWDGVIHWNTAAGHQKKEIPITSQMPLCEDTYHPVPHLRVICVQESPLPAQVRQQKCFGFPGMLCAKGQCVVCRCCLSNIWPISTFSVLLCCSLNAVLLSCKVCHNSFSNSAIFILFHMVTFHKMISRLFSTHWSHSYPSRLFLFRIIICFILWLHVYRPISPNWIINSHKARNIH